MRDGLDAARPRPLNPKPEDSSQSQSRMSADDLCILEAELLPGSNPLSESTVVSGPICICREEEKPRCRFPFRGQGGGT